MKTFLFVMALMAAPSAFAKINPTELGMQCLVRAIRAGEGAETCFTARGWTGRDGGRDFVAQQKRKGWSVDPVKAGPCCNEPVLWARVDLTRDGKTVDSVWLIFEKVDGILKIDRLTEEAQPGLFTNGATPTV